MNKAKILIVTECFYPQITARSLRATELAKELARQGNDVLVLTSERKSDISAFENENKLKCSSFGKPRLRELIVKGGKFQLFFKRSLRRLLIMFFEYPVIELMWRVKQALRYQNNYDLLISIAAPHSIHWGVAWARNKDHPIAEKWIADCGDPYMGDKTDTFRKLFYFKYLEKWFCRKADYISVPVTEAIGAYYPEFRHKIVVIPQGFCFSNLKLAHYQKTKDYPIFALAGSLNAYKDSAPPFFEYLLSVKSRFKFIIYTEMLGWAEEYVHNLGTRAEVRKFIAREQLVYELSKMDFLVNFMYKTNVQRSSKLINYVLSGRPILNVEAGTDIVAIVPEFFSGDYHQRLIINNIEDNNIMNIARQFIELA
jgi:hypothetical protein